LQAHNPLSDTFNRAPIRESFHPACEYFGLANISHT
jgi:hypothetical protein